MVTKLPLTLMVAKQGIGAVGNLIQIVTFQISATLLELGLTSLVFFHVGVPAIIFPPSPLRFPRRLVSVA